LKAKNRHGVHSPFVYKLLDEVIYFKGHYYNYDKVNSIRTRMLRDNSILKITDLGAGSKKLGQARKVSAIARTSVKNKKLGELIYRLAVHQQAGTTLELGTSLGITTSYFALANTKSAVYTIEGDPKIRQIAIQNFHSLALTNVHSIEGNFDLILDELLNNIQEIGLAFIDGNHKKEPVLNYVNKILPKIQAGGLVIIDDIYWSREMTEAWEELIRIPEFTVSIDLYYFGILFVRPGQTKEHFFIKI